MPMAYQHGQAAPEIGAEALDEVYRAVASPRAADGDRERAPAVLAIARQPGLDEAADVLEHSPHFRFALEKLDHGGVETAQGTEPRVVVRVGEAAHVEDKVRIEGDPLLVAEGFKQKHHRFRADFEHVLDPVAQSVGQQVGRVETMTDLAHRSEQLALVDE